MSFSRFCGVLVVTAIPLSAFAQEDAAAIRAGRNLATSKCFACHLVSADQSLPPPIMGPRIPSFEEIGSRPGITTQYLIQRMKTAVWHDAALPPTLLPMSNLSDREKEQVAIYILSLRKQD